MTRVYELMTRVFVEDVKKEAYKWCNNISGTFNSTHIWVKQKVKNFDLFSPSLAFPSSVSIQVKKADRNVFPHVFI